MTKAKMQHSIVLHCIALKLGYIEWLTLNFCPRDSCSPSHNNPQSTDITTKTFIKKLSYGICEFLDTKKKSTFRPPISLF